MDLWGRCCYCSKLSASFPEIAFGAAHSLNFLNCEKIFYTLDFKWLKVHWNQVEWLTWEASCGAWNDFDYEVRRGFPVWSYVALRVVNFFWGPGGCQGGEAFPQRRWWWRWQAWPCHWRPSRLLHPHSKAPHSLLIFAERLSLTFLFNEGDTVSKPREEVEKNLNHPSSTKRQFCVLHKKAVS